MYFKNSMFLLNYIFLTLKIKCIRYLIEQFKITKSIKQKYILKNNQYL